jgi:hypothetical protein
MLPTGARVSQLGRVELGRLALRPRPQSHRSVTFVEVATSRSGPGRGCLQSPLDQVRLLALRAIPYPRAEAEQRLTNGVEDPFLGQPFPTEPAAVAADRCSLIPTTSASPSRCQFYVPSLGLDCALTVQIAFLSKTTCAQPLSGVDTLTIVT